MENLRLKNRTLLVIALSVIAFVLVAILRATLPELLRFFHGQGVTLLVWTILLTLLLTTPLGLLFVRRQLRPLRQLQQLQARILAIRDQPTLALLPQQYANDAIGVLAQNFDNLMRDRLFAEARYQTGAEELRAAANSGLDAFFIFQARRTAAGPVTDFTIRYLNANAERMLGQPLSALMQQSLLTSLGSHPVAALFDKYVQVMRTGEPLQEEGRGQVSADGAPVRWFLHQIVPQAEGVALTLCDITERRRQEHSLRSNQSLLNAVNDSSPLGLFTTDLAGNCTYVNKTYEQMSGYIAQDVVGDGWSRSLHPEDQDAAIEGWVAAIQRRQPYHGVHRFLSPQGRTVVGSFKAVPTMLDEQVTGYVGSVDDITLRMDVERALRASEQRLRLVTDNIPALISYVTPDQRFEFANRKYQHAFGLTHADLSGMTKAEVLASDVYAQSAPYIEGALRGVPANFERLVTHVGQLRWERVSYVPDVDAEDNIHGFFSLVEDITELKQAQHTFAKSEMRLRMITDNLPALVGFIDRNERFQFNNQVHAEWLDRPLSEITGHTMQDVYGEDNYRLYKPYFDQALMGSKVEFEFEAMRHGAPHYYRVAYTPQFDGDGIASGVCSMISDITALKKVENQLRILARFDSLTGLPNRNQFEEKLVEAIARSNRSKRAMAVMFLDIDHFKNINDSIGHQGGDAVLQEFSRRLQHCVRKTDTVWRCCGWYCRRCVPEPMIASRLPCGA